MTETIKLPTKVIDSDWKDDIDYEPYNNETEYIQPQRVENATAEQAKRRSIKIGRVALFGKDEKFAAQNKSHSSFPKKERISPCKTNSEYQLKRKELPIR